MIRKLTVILLTGVICLLATAPLLAETNWGWSTLQEYEEITGNKIEKFNEAPMLSVKVATGELPPIEKRLPEEPLVDKPFEEVGRYGGELSLAMLGPAARYPASLYIVEYMLLFDRKAEKVVPNIAKGWELSNDMKIFTLYLRKGMKWSDGAPFTADDIMFWWESTILNDELTPVKPGWLKWGGKLANLEKVDDYTIRFRFSAPYPTVIYHLSSTMCEGQQSWVFLPKHALEKYHIEYNPKANELAKEKGYDYWWQLFKAKSEYHFYTSQGPDIPVLGPWIVKKVLLEGVIYERNPYYYKIDTAGNQLPYIDTVKATIAGDMETMLLKMVTGALDYQDWEASIMDYPVLMKNREKGGYHVWLVKNPVGAVPYFLINENYKKDPAVAKIFRDLRFRQALSLAINREELNEIVHLGKGVPRQATVAPSCSFYKEEWGKYYAEYDPERANALLDEMGMDKRDSAGYRLRPDGKPFTIRVLLEPLIKWINKTCELTKEYWENVGIRTALEPQDATLLYERIYAGMYQVIVLAMSGSNEMTVITGNCLRWMEQWAPDWYKWCTTEGKEGEEPPENIKTMRSLYEKVPSLSKEERDQVLQEVFTIFMKHLPLIGTVGLTPKPAITNVNLGNINMDTTAAFVYACGNFNRLYQAFWKQ